MPVTANDALMQQAQSRPEDTAFIFQANVWTYRQLAHESERVAQGFAARGLRAGDRVVLHMMNRPEMLVAYYACFRLGAIAAPLRTAFTSAELTPMLERLRPSIYIGDSMLYPNVTAVDAAILPLGKRFIVDDADRTHGAQPWDVLRQSAPVDLPIPTASDDPIVLVNTSGSTGQPKFVMHPQGTIAAMMPLLGKHFCLRATDVIISPLQMAHASGLYLSLGYVLAGVPFVILQRGDGHTVLD